MRLSVLRPSFVLGLLLVPTLAFGQQGDAEKVIALGKSDSRVMEHLDHLANRIGPRLTGSDGFTNACEWARGQFEAFGLTNARLEKWGEFPVGFNRGPSSGHMRAPDEKELHFATNAWTAGTHGPTRGPALLAPTNDKELDALKGKLAYCAGITATPPMVKPFEAIFAPVINLDPELQFKVREVKGLSGGGSDHSSFLSANVPGFFWSQRGRANYNHTHHTQFDTFDAAIPEYQRNSSIVIAIGALGIANLPDLLSRENLRASGGGGGRRLGVQLADDMTITEVTEDGLAAKAGLQVGDKLVKIGDTAVADNDEMRTTLREGPAKTKVVVLRKGKQVDVAIEFPPDPAGPAAGAARRLGVRLAEDLTLDVITPGSAGDQAGFVAGDKVVKVAGKAVASTKDLADALADASGTVKIAVMRDGKEVVVSVTLN